MHNQSILKLEIKVLYRYVYYFNCKLYCVCAIYTADICAVIRTAKTGSIYMASKQVILTLNLSIQSVYFNAN